MTLALIRNMIEDAFVEAAGCSLFDHLVFFLQFLRPASLYGSKQEEGTASRVISEGMVSEEPAEPLPSEQITQSWRTKQRRIFVSCKERERRRSIATTSEQRHSQRQKDKSAIMPR